MFLYLTYIYIYIYIHIHIYIYTHIIHLYRCFEKRLCPEKIEIFPKPDTLSAGGNSIRVWLPFETGHIRDSEKDTSPSL